MIGELNASHLGMTGQAAAAGDRPDRPRFDRAEYETSGALRVTDVVPLGPAAVTRDSQGRRSSRRRRRAAVGSPASNLDELLANTIDRRVVLAVVRAAARIRSDVVVRPTNQATEKDAALPAVGRAEPRVRAEGERRPARLRAHDRHERRPRSISSTSISTPRTMRATASSSTSATTTAASSTRTRIDVFTRQPYLKMALARLPEAPARTLLGQRALELPTVLVTNQHSLSDAEDFTEGYRTLKLGPVVGEPTAGWIIYTSERPARGRIDAPPAAHAHPRRRRQRHGTPPATGRRRGHAADRRDADREGLAARRGRARAAEETREG